MKFARVLAWAFAALFTFSPVVVVAKGSHRGGTVHVKGYTKKDGTYVAPHNRSAPNGTKADNWTTKGNVNPYTGKEGTKNGGASSASSPQTNAAQERTAIAGVRSGMTKAQVTAAFGEPNLKSSTKWLYSKKGWIIFQGDMVVSAELTK